MPRLTRAQRDHVYGAPCTPAAHQLVAVFGNRVAAHRLVADHLVRTLEAADRALLAAGVQHTRPARVDGYNCRDIRALVNPSMHAYALAWDIFRTPPGVPPPGGVLTPTLALHPVFVGTLEAAGFTWGGRFRRADRPHFEWAGPPPR